MPESLELDAAHLAFKQAQKARMNAEPGWRPSVLMLHPDEKTVIEFYSYDEAVSWLRWHLVNLEELAEDKRSVR